MTSFDDATLFVVDLFAEGDAFPSDCLGEFYTSRVDAERAGLDEVERVLQLHETERDEFDWAVGYSVRRCDPLPRV